MNGIQFSHHIYLIKHGRKTACETDKHILLVVSGVQATEHQTKALDDPKQTRDVGDYELRVETELPRWFQLVTEGLTRGSSSSADVTPAVSLSAHPPAKPT